MTTKVSNVEAASTVSSGILISNTGDVTIGGVSAALQGIQAPAAGDVTLVNAGSITFGESGPSYTVFGNGVTLIANGANSDILATIATDVVRATGNSLITAGRDLKLNAIDNDIDVVGDCTITAGRDVALAGDANVRAGVLGGPGALFVTAARTLSIDSTAGAAASTTSGNITLSADDMVFSGAIPVFTPNVVTLQQGSTTARPIDLGLGTTLNTLGLSKTELNIINASLIRIGRTDNTGNITLTDTVTPAVATTLGLYTGGAILETTAAEAADITVANLAHRCRHRHRQRE